MKGNHKLFITIKVCTEVNDSLTNLWMCWDVKIDDDINMRDVQPSVKMKEKQENSFEYNGAMSHECIVAILWPKIKSLISGTSAMKQCPIAAKIAGSIGNLPSWLKWFVHIGVWMFADLCSLSEPPYFVYEKFGLVAITAYTKKLPPTATFFFKSRPMSRNQIYFVVWQKNCI